MSTGKINKKYNKVFSLDSISSKSGIIQSNVLYFSNKKEKLIEYDSKSDNNNQMQVF